MSLLLLAIVGRVVLLEAYPSRIDSFPIVVLPALVVLEVLQLDSHLTLEN